MTAAGSDGSQAGLTRVLERWTGAAQPWLAREVFGMAALLDEQGSLRRALTDAAHTDDERAALSWRVFYGKVSQEAGEVLDALVRQRHHHDRGLTDALGAAGLILAGSAAENRAGAEGLDNVIDDVLGFQALLDSDADLQRAVTDSRASGSAKLRLLDRVAPSLSEEGRLLVEQAVTHPRGALPQRLLGTFADHLAALRDRWIAHVATPLPLDETQLDRLRAALGRFYGRDLKVVVETDRSLVGGLRVTVGDEVLDGSVATRLNELQLKLGA